MLIARPGKASRARGCFAGAHVQPARPPTQFHLPASCSLRTTSDSISGESFVQNLGSRITCTGIPAPRARSDDPRPLEHRP